VSGDGGGPARVTVVIPCFNDGAYLPETLDSIREAEPVVVVVVDDGSSDPATLALYPELEARGIRVLRLPENRGQAASRNAGVAAATTPYVFNLDADDLLVSGVLGRMADRLDADRAVAACYGDYEEFGARTGVRRTAPALDAFRVAYVNKWPGLALFRREALLEAGGWSAARGYEDWDLWMTLAERGIRAVHCGCVVFRYRVDPVRSFGGDRARHGDVFRELRRRHPALFARLREHRRRSPLPWYWKLAYPLLYAGGRPRLERLRSWVRRVVPAWSPGMGAGARKPGSGA
jgi:glycosyltransferase involved in cell wall biosynthesis